MRDVNRNLRRRPLPGLFALCLAAPLRLLLAPLRRRRDPAAPPVVFASYMVGDLYMALPSLRLLANAGARILCRPDCVPLLARRGIDAVPFANAFLTRRTPGGFLATVRAAWGLRCLPAGEALDLDADPRSALWLRIAGFPRVTSYRRDFGVLFDDPFPLPPGTAHQADRDLAVAKAWLARAFGAETADAAARRARTGTARTEASPPPSFSSGLPMDRETWLLSVWTRKAGKNWALDGWDRVIDRLEARGITCLVVTPPDGDATWKAWQARRAATTRFVEGNLAELEDIAAACAGVIATDNFLGHMGGALGKPVLWINVCSPREQVLPRGPRTLDARVAGGAPARPEDVEGVLSAFARLRGA